MELAQDFSTVLSVTAETSDDRLRDIIARHPHVPGLAIAQAEHAYKQIMAHPCGTALGVPAFWQESMRLRMPSTAVDQFRAAIDIGDILTAVLDDIYKLSFPDLQTLQSKEPPGYLLPRMHDITSRYPGLAAFQKRKDEIAARIAAAEKQDMDATIKRDAHARIVAKQEQARATLRRLAAAGIVLTATQNGISARPAALLGAGDLEAIQGLRAELIELLTAPAAMVA